MVSRGYFSTLVFMSLCVWIPDEIEGAHFRALFVPQLLYAMPVDWQEDHVGLCSTTKRTWRAWNANERQAEGEGVANGPTMHPNKNRAPGGEKCGEPLGSKEVVQTELFLFYFARHVIEEHKHTLKTVRVQQAGKVWMGINAYSACKKLTLPYYTYNASTVPYFMTQPGHAVVAGGSDETRRSCWRWKYKWTERW